VVRFVQIGAPAECYNLTREDDMKVKIVRGIGLGIIGFGLLATSLVKADPAPDPESAEVVPVPSVAATAAPAGPGALRLGLTLVPAPFGSLTSGPPGAEFSVASEFAFGVMPVLDVSLAHHLFVGFAPSYTFNVKAQGGAPDPASELDLLLRIGAEAAATDRLHIYGYVSPGYAFMFGLPSQTTGRGPVVGLHGGARLDLTAAFFVNAEVGFQAGFQTAPVDGSSREYYASFMQIGLGAGVRI
jgi:hypothetical protein